MKGALEEAYMTEEEMEGEMKGKAKQDTKN